MSAAPMRGRGGLPLMCQPMRRPRPLRLYPAKHPRALRLRRLRTFQGLASSPAVKRGKRIKGRGKSLGRRAALWRQKAQRNHLGRRSGGLRSLAHSGGKAGADGF